MIRRYQLYRRRGVRFTNGALHGPQGVVVLELLVDTGAAFSLISPVVLRVIGIDPSEAERTNRLRQPMDMLRFPLRFELDLGVIQERLTADN